MYYYTCIGVCATRYRVHRDVVRWRRIRRFFEGIARHPAHDSPRIHPVHTAHALHKYSLFKRERNRVRSRHIFSLRTIYLLHHA